MINVFIQIWVYFFEGQKQKILLHHSFLLLSLLKVSCIQRQINAILSPFWYTMGWNSFFKCILIFMQLHYQETSLLFSYHFMSGSCLISILAEEKTKTNIQNLTLNLLFGALLKWHDPHVSEYFRKLSKLFFIEMNRRTTTSEVILIHCV